AHLPGAHAAHAALHRPRGDHEDPGPGGAPVRQRHEQLDDDRDTAGRRPAGVPGPDPGARGADGCAPGVYLCRTCAGLYRRGAFRVREALVYRRIRMTDMSLIAVVSV